jgi:hypothetical protein
VRAIRGLGALLLWLLATLLLLVAVILSLTVVLLPVGLLLGALALRLYRRGLGLILPRKRDLQLAMRKAAAPDPKGNSSYPEEVTQAAATNYSLTITR